MTVKASDETIVTLKKMNVPYKTVWRYEGKGCLMDSHSALAHAMPEQGSSGLSLCAIPGTVQRSGQSIRMDRVTLLPSGSALSALVLLVVHQAPLSAVSKGTITKVK